MSHSAEFSSPAARLLLRNFELRKQRNASYSLRAFARDLGISAGVISEILSKKRPLSLELGRRILPQLHLSPNDKAIFLRAILPGEAEEFLPLHRSATPYETIGDVHSRIISDWEHFAILSLIKTDDFRSESCWISKRLGIEERQVDEALMRLSRAGLIKRVKDKIKRCNPQLTTTTDIPSQAIRKGHAELLKQAANALKDLPVEARHITSTTIAMSPKRLGEAKQLINEFHRAMTELLEEGPRTEVYNLNVQLVPVTQSRVSLLNGEVNVEVSERHPTQESRDTKNHQSC